MSSDGSHEPLSFSGGPVSSPSPTTAPRRRVNRTAEAMSVVGLALVVIGTFFPYARFVISVEGVRLIDSRSAWQMGANDSIDIFAGPAIVFWAVIASAQDVVHYLPRGSNDGIRRTFLTSGIRSQVINAVIITVLCVQNWPGSWANLVDTTVVRGSGGYISIAGVALFALSINFRYHDSLPTSTPR